jgi:hypothetical protein
MPVALSQALIGHFKALVNYLAWPHNLAPYNHPLSLKMIQKITFGMISALVLISSGQAAKAVTLDEACAKFAAKMAEAQATGNPDNVNKVFSKGSQRVASKFNGATCPNVKAP